MGNRKIFNTKNVAKPIKLVLIVNKYKAPNAYSQFPIAKPNPTVHRGGIKAVAIATPKITLAIVPFFALAITNAKPPKNAMSTSRISGAVRAKSSEDSSRKGKNLKNRSEERRVGKEKKYRRTYKHIIKNIR